MVEEIITQERERIKAHLRRKQEAINIICDEKKTKRGKKSLARSLVWNWFNELIWLIDNPDYVPITSQNK